MKHLNKLVPVLFSAMLGMTAMTSCEGGDLFSVDAPDWITSAADSIAASKVVEEVVLEGMMEDVYTIGATDFTSGWWSQFSKQYIVPDGETWNAQFTLNINSSDNTYYKNFALVITNDEYTTISGSGYSEYGAFRFDATNDSTSYNSQWGVNYTFPFKYTDCTMMLAPESNADANVQKLAGKVTLIVDRSNPNQFSITMQNSTVTKTYVQPYPIGNLNTDESNTNIRCFLCVEGSYINFLSTNIEPIGGCTSALDKDPVSLTLNNVPDEVALGTSLEDAMANVTATVEFEEGVTMDVTAEDLHFTAIPDMDTPGQKTLIVVYNKTFKGENASVPVVANATFKVVEKVVSLKVLSEPSNTTYAIYDVEGISLEGRTLAFYTEGMQVEAAYANGETAIIDNSKLTYTSVPATVGKHTVTMSVDGVEATVDVNVEASKAVAGKFSPSTLGAEDNTTGWWSVFTDDQKVESGSTQIFKFTNYTCQANNWNNFVVILRNAVLGEYAVARGDNWGWGTGLDGGRNGDVCNFSDDYASWLAAMNGAKVTVYVTNCGNGTADLQVVMEGTDGNTYTVGFFGIYSVVPDDLYVSFTLELAHLVAE